MGDDRPNRYVEDGVTVYRASGLGGCVKALAALGLGHEPLDHPEWLRGKFDEGIRGEPVVIGMMEADGWKFVDERDGWWLNWHDGQIMVEIPVGSRCIIRGHLDGVAVRYRAESNVAELRVGDGRRMVEVKCCSEGYAAEVLRRLPVMYDVQISAYMGWLGLPGVLAVGVKDRETGEVVRVATKEIAVPPRSLAKVKARVMEIERRVREGELGACDYRQYPCQFPWLCDEIVGSGPGGVLDATSDEELMDVMAASVRAVRIKKALERRDE